MARGGRREGAGRPKGALTVRKREVALQAAARGLSPIDVMLENMLHFHKVAKDAEATLEHLTLEEFTGKHGENLTPAEQFKALLAEVKKTAGLRQVAQECARDAAPYIHPRLANVQVGGDPDNPLVVTDAKDRLARLIAGHAAAREDSENTGKPH